MSLLQVNIKLEQIIKDLELPQECSTTINNKQLHLVGPCGQMLFKLIYLGSSAIKASEVDYVVSKAKQFLTTNLDKLKLYFSLRTKYKNFVVPQGVRFVHNTNIKEAYIQFGNAGKYKHLYHKNINCIKPLNRTATFQPHSLNFISTSKLHKIIDFYEENKAEITNVFKEIYAEYSNYKEYQKISSELNSCSF